MIELDTFLTTDRANILFHNIRELLQFVMPILMLFVAIPFAKKFIRTVRAVMPDARDWKRERERENYEKYYDPRKDRL